MSSYTYVVVGDRVTYTITDDLGVVREHSVYGVGSIYGFPDLDIVAHGNALLAKLPGALARREVKAWLDDDNAPIAPTYATPAQWRDGIRAAYRNANTLEACRIAYKIRKHFQAGEITSAQLQALFGMTGPQLTTLFSTKITPQADAYAATLTAGGA